MYEARNVLRQNQSHPLARDDNVVDNDRHGEKSKLRFISGENPFVPGHRDPTVPVTQCNGLCHVTHIAGYTSGYTVAITPPRSDCLKRISQSDFESV